MYGYRLCKDYNVRTVGTGRTCMDTGSLKTNVRTGRICTDTGSMKTNVRTVGTGRICTDTGSVKTTPRLRQGFYSYIIFLFQNT